MFKLGFSFFKKALSDLFFPRVCAFCDSPEDWEDSGLCRTCSDSIKFVGGLVCETCGLPLPGIPPHGGATCGRCLTRPPKFARARYGIRYEGPVRDAIVHFKYRGALHAGRPLSELLIQSFHQHFHKSQFDLIVPVPIHLNRLAHRGFNQAVILAQRLSAETGIRLNRTALKKVKDTPPQVGLTRVQRIANLKGSFGVSNPAAVKNQRILLVDDVATTGSTVAECSMTLVAAKARRVDVLVLALRSDSAKDDVSEAIALAPDRKVL